MDGRLPDSEWSRRAEEGWRALARSCLRRGRRGVAVREPRARRAVPLWPLSQVLHAAIATGAPETDALLALLERYRRGSAYAERPGSRRRYYDDNAWVALAALDLSGGHGTTLARRVVGFLLEGERGAAGVRWVEGGNTTHACSTASSGLAATRLARLGAEGGDELAAFAEACVAFVTGKLLDSRGLVADHLRADGSVEPTVWTYNQGVTIGLLAELGRVDEARALATRVLREFDPDRLWKQPPAFNGILVRELVALHRRDGDERWPRYCADYLDRAWQEARRPTDGLFRQGGIGQYDTGVALDHAGLVVAMAAMTATDIRPG